MFHNRRVIFNAAPGRAKFQSFPAGQVGTDVLGEQSHGVVVSDFYAGYNTHFGLPPRCRVHLWRDVHERKAQSPRPGVLCRAKELRDIYDFPARSQKSGRLTLALQTLNFEGPQGRYNNSIMVRFGRIPNIEEVKALFANSPHSQSELAVLRYNGEPVSKPGQIFIELAFERIEARLVIQCAHLTITDEENL